MWPKTGPPCALASHEGTWGRSFEDRTGDRTLSLVWQLSHLSHRMVERSPQSMRGVNGRGWDRTSDLPRVKGAFSQVQLANYLPIAL